MASHVVSVRAFDALGVPVGERWWVRCACGLTETTSSEVEALELAARHRLGLEQLRAAMPDLRGDVAYWPPTPRGQDAQDEANQNRDRSAAAGSLFVSAGIFRRSGLNARSTGGDRG